MRKEDRTRNTGSMRRWTAWSSLLVPLAMVVSCDGGDDELGQTQQEVHGEVSLAGSEFEIDTDANLKVDDSAPSIDWGNVTEVRKPDKASGAGDDSLGEGTKEDAAVPSVVDGSIPPNKSDLLNFGVHLESTAGRKFLHMFWHRVQEPQGTTNMDFEFNQKKASGLTPPTKADNGITPARTKGDLLIQYDLSQGGVNPVLFLSRWLDGTEVPAQTAATACEATNSYPCWSKKVNLTTAGNATGSINSSPIPSADSDGLGNISARTFGEATIDFTAIVSGTTCVSFGSAYLKSRSSDQFTSALKDFIAPVETNISNCGTVRVVKKDDVGTLLAGATFKLIKDFAPTNNATGPGAEDSGTNEVIVGTCTTTLPTGSCSFTSVVQGSYWLIETAAPAGHTIASPNYQYVELVADQTVSKEFVNPRQRGAIRVTKTRKHAAAGAGDHPHAGVSFTVNGVTQQTGANGTTCFDGLLFAAYTVTETVPAGYRGESPKSVTVDNAASCSDATYVGENVSFQNMPLSNITVSFESQVAGGTAATISCTGLTATPPDGTPNAFDDTSEQFKDLVPGTYTCTVVVDP